MDEFSVVVNAELDTSDVEKGLKKLQNGKETVTVEVEADTSKAQKQIAQDLKTLLGGAAIGGTIQGGKALASAFSKAYGLEIGEVIAGAITPTSAGAAGVAALSIGTLVEEIKKLKNIGEIGDGHSVEEYQQNVENLTEALKQAQIERKNLADNGGDLTMIDNLIGETEVAIKHANREYEAAMKQTGRIADSYSESVSKAATATQEAAKQTKGYHQELVDLSKEAAMPFGEWIASKLGLQTTKHGDINVSDGLPFKSLEDFQQDIQSLSDTTLRKLLTKRTLGESEFEELHKWMQDCGYDADNLTRYIESAAEAMEQNRASIVDEIGDLTSLQDELSVTTEALSAYKSALSQGEKGKAASSLESIYKGALSDLDAGKYDTNRLKAAAELLFSQEQLAAMNYDIQEVGKKLRSSLISALFDSSGDQTAGQRMVQQIMDNADLFEGIAKVTDNGNGTVTFMYNSLQELADAFGISQAAMAAFLDEWDSYGVEVMRSTQENLELINQFQEIAKNADTTSDAVSDFITALSQGGRDNFEISSILASLQDAGVISMSVEELNAQIAETTSQLDALDDQNPEPTISLDTSAATSAALSFQSLLYSIAAGSYTAYMNVVTSNVSAPTTTSSANKKTSRAIGGTVPAAGDTLVNELGPELISDRGVAYIANGGRPGFTYLSKDAVVFNAEDTEQIFKHGFADIPFDSFATGTKSLRDRLISGQRKPAQANVLSSLLSKVKNTVSNAVNTVKNTVTGNTSKTTTTTSTVKTTTPTTTTKTTTTGSTIRPSTTTTTTTSTSNNTMQCAYCRQWINKSSLISGTYCPRCDHNAFTGGARASTGSTAGNNATTNNPTTASNIKGNDSLIRCAHCKSYVNVGRLTYGVYCPNCGYNAYTGAAAPTSNSNVGMGAMRPSGSTGGNAAVTTSSTGTIGQATIDAITDRYASGQTGIIGSSGAGGTGSYGGSGYGGAGVGGSSYQSQSDPEKIDWINVRLNRLMRTAADLQKISSSGFKQLSTRLTKTKEEISAITDEIGDSQKAYERYLQEAESVGLSSDLAEKVRNGTIDITKYDADTVDKIREYTEWYENAITAKSNIENLHQDIAQLYTDAFDAIEKDFQNQLKQIEHNADLVQSDLAMSQAKGLLTSSTFYEKMASYQANSIALLKDELSNLTSYFNQAVASGEIAANSEAWYDMTNEINAVKEAIAQANVQLANFQKTIRELNWSYFDYAQQRFEQLNQEASFLVSIMSNNQLFDKRGQFTNTGAATVGLHVESYDAYMAQADAYRKEMLEVQKALAENPYDTEIIERRETLLGLQQRAIENAEQEKNAIRDLVSQGIQIELSSLADLIDAYNESLDSAKDLYSYQKAVASQASDIASIEKQLTAYQNDTSDENRARVQKLQKQLKEARENLAETEYTQSIADQKKLLSELYNEYESFLNGRLDDVDLLMKEMVNATNQNAVTITKELQTVASQVGYSISNELKNMFTGSSMAYYDTGFQGNASVQRILSSIFENVNAMARASGAIKSYAGGGEVDYTGLAMVHGTPSNPEFMLTADEYARYKQTGKSLAAIADSKQAESFLSKRSSKMPSTVKTETATPNVTNNITVNIPIDHVLDYNELLYQLANDKNFDNLVNAMTLDRVCGKGYMHKFKALPQAAVEAGKRLQK